MNHLQHQAALYSLRTDAVPAAASSRRHSALEDDAASALVGLCSSPVSVVPSNCAPPFSSLSCSLSASSSPAAFAAVPPPPPVWSSDVRGREELTQEHPRKREEHQGSLALLHARLAAPNANGNKSSMKQATMIGDIRLAESMYSAALQCAYGHDVAELAAKRTIEDLRRERMTGENAQQGRNLVSMTPHQKGAKTEVTPNANIAPILPMRQWETKNTNVNIKANAGSKSKKNKDDSYFPVVLMSIVNDPVNSDVISWTPDGLAFVIRHPFDLAENVLPRYFQGRSGKYCSFARKLHRYGFRRTAAVDLYGTDFVNTAPAYHYGRSPGSSISGGQEDVFSHELFLRDAPELCREIRVVPGGASKASACKREAKKPAKSDRKVKKLAKGNKKFKDLVESTSLPSLNGGNVANKSDKEVQWQNEFRAREFAAPQTPSSPPALMPFDTASPTAAAISMTPSPLQPPHLPLRAHRDLVRSGAGEILDRAAAAAAAKRKEQRASVASFGRVLLHREARRRFFLQSQARSGANRRANSVSEALSLLDPRERSELIARYDPHGEGVRDILRRAVNVIKEC
uniref:HSF-type DNA-binding domain-containing protein n=1 Tax=Odontella aurita TaxID=265563 RepID=A0A7S4JJS1_9STRA|mmetsp:Transcript_47547/g.143874  ORF Transcript_47547/g.143874 Transcript_47547/m.143874 type:complete len:573 (+) Transcript_47547:161-1879(+)